MTLHNISGSEVGARRPLPYVREIKARRPISGRVLWLVAPPAGVLAFVLDQLVGFPICVVLILAGFVAWILKPERR